MDDQFKICLNRLRDGQTQEIDLELDPAFLEVNEPGLSFQAPVFVHGEAYFADAELIIHLSSKTKGIIPCSICSEPVVIPVESKGAYHTVPLNEIKGNEYDFRDLIRENLLLEVPSFAECKGKCPEREQLKKYFKQGDGNTDREEGQQPFSHLSL